MTYTLFFLAITAGFILGWIAAHLHVANGIFEEMAAKFKAESERKAEEFEMKKEIEFREFVNKLGDFREILAKSSVIPGDEHRDAGMPPIPKKEG